MRAVSVATLMIAVALAGCVGGDDAATLSDDGVTKVQGQSKFNADPIPVDSDTDNKPARPIPDPLEGLELLTYGETSAGRGIWLWNDVAYVTGAGQEAVAIFDVRDPENPVKIGNITAEHSSTGGLSARDVDVLNYGDRTVVALSQGGPMIFFDVTDPANPIELARFSIPSHNLAVHRPAHVVYNSRSLGSPTGGAEIIDATDPDNIKLYKAWEFDNVAADGTPVANTGCHDVKVYPDQNRAYCAAVTQTLIWDITDPLNPTVLTAIDNPLINIHHSAHTILDHTVLVIGDEYGGAAVYACYGNVQSGIVGDVSSPTGAIWFYDLTTPAPTLMSWLSPPPVDNPPRTCTAHFGDVIGGDESGMFVYGWYTAGTLLVDATDARMPTIVDQAITGGTVWDAQEYRGYVFTGDSGGGLGVLTLKGPLPA